MCPWLVVICAGMAACATDPPLRGAPSAAEAISVSREQAVATCPMRLAEYRALLDGMGKSSTKNGIGTFVFRDDVSGIDWRATTMGEAFLKIPLVLDGDFCIAGQVRELRIYALRGRLVAEAAPSRPGFRQTTRYVYR